MTTPTEIPTVEDLRKHGTRALATYITNLWSQRIVEVQDESGHLERACLNANLDRWIEIQCEAHEVMKANTNDLSTKGLAAYWTARERYDRASVEVERAYRRLQDPHAPTNPPTEPNPPKSKARSRKKNDQPQES